MGRSGTTFVANLLNCATGVSAGHERIGNREYWLLSWYLGSNYSRPFLRKEKTKIDQKFAGFSTYVDVNSYLQNSVDDLKSVFGTQQVLHLVRDPKEVVRSIYTRRNDIDIHLLPKTEKEVNEWLDADRFYQVCKNWRIAMDQLVEKGVSTIQFEKITTDYSYLQERILDPFSIDLSKELWVASKDQRANKTPIKPYRYLYAKLKGKQFQPDELGRYETWPTAYKEIYSELCEEYAKTLGY